MRAEDHKILFVKRPNAFSGSRFYSYSTIGEFSFAKFIETMLVIHDDKNPSGFLFFLFQYEPVIQPGNENYLHHMTLYECRGRDVDLEEAAKANGSVCYEPNAPALQCTSIAATWSLGSEVSCLIIPIMTIQLL